jgi:hypothetical protein
MAICSALSAGLDKSCDNNAGGVNKIYIADFDAVTSPITIGAATSPQVGDWIDAITMGSGADDHFYEVKTNKNVCNFTETVAVDLANGTTFFNQVVTLELSRRETTKRTFIQKLIAGQKQLRLIVLDSNGNYWFFGFAEGAYVTAIEGGSGTAKADKNGYTVTFTAMEPDQAYQVDPTIVAALVA